MSPYQIMSTEIKKEEYNKTLFPEPSEELIHSVKVAHVRYTHIYVNVTPDLYLRKISKNYGKITILF